jgi:prephenate dehydrogenase
MRIVIVGPGLIGRSIALATRRADRSAEIVEIDREGSIDAAWGANLIVLATPVDVILNLLRDHAELLRSSVVLDVGSTKRAIVATARTAGLTTFVGGHPMAGGSTAGPAHASADLFDGKPFFLIGRDANSEARQLVTSFVQRLGATPILMEDDGTHHDAVMAAISHLPQLVASALMVLVANQAGEHLQWAGNGLRDATRLAQGPAHVWQSIADTNAEALKPLLHELAGQLETLADSLGDGRRVGELMEKANRARALLEERALL